MTNNREMGGVFRMKREIKKLKAEIRELKEDLATSEAIARKFMGRATEERDRAGELMAVNKEIGNLAWEAEQKVHAAQKATYAVYEPMLDSFLALSKLASAVSKSTL